MRISYSNAFAEDLLYLFLSDNKLYDFIALKLAIELISHGKKLPKRYHQHQLKHMPNHIMDVHIEHDWILLYKISDKRPLTMILYRTGFHKQLFKKYYLIEGCKKNYIDKVLKKKFKFCC